MSDQQERRTLSTEFDIGTVWDDRWGEQWVIVYKGDEGYVSVACDTLVSSGVTQEPMDPEGVIVSVPTPYQPFPDSSEDEADDDECWSCEGSGRVGLDEHERPCPTCEGRKVIQRDPLKPLEWAQNFDPCPDCIDGTRTEILTDKEQP